MKNSELEQLLKSARPPEPREDFLRELPTRVSAKVSWKEPLSPSFTNMKRPVRLAWCMAALVIAALVVFTARMEFAKAKVHSISARQLTEARTYYREMEALFPHQLKAIVFDKDGPSMVLADKPTVADAIPLYLKICSPAGCKEYITFSGQKILVNGESCEILANGQGRVMAVGENRVWEGSTAGPIRFQGIALEAAL